MKWMIRLTKLKRNAVNGMNFERYVNSKFYHFIEILYKLLIINFLWLIISTIGFVVLTLMPAVIATYVVINSMNHDREFALVKSFFLVFRKEYWRSQKLLYF